MGEGAVLLVERWILARIRNETFFSLSELNRRLRELIEDLNGRPFQKLPGTRRSAFEEIDRPALKPLHLILTAPRKRFHLEKTADNRPTWISQLLVERCTIDENLSKE